MKIRNKLIAGFIISTVFPLLLTLFSINIILHRQNELYPQNNDINLFDFHEVDLLKSPLEVVSELNTEEYDALSNTVKKNPDKLLDSTYLHKIDKRLKGKKSYLLLLKDGKYLYKGNVTDRLPNLPIVSNYHEKSGNLTFFDNNENALARELTFLYSDGSLGQVFVVTDFTDMQDGWWSSLRNIIFCLCIIFVATNALFYAWIYQSIIRPLHILQLAATQIGDGNLNEPILVTGKDEIGQLCTDFDNMRIRLKSIINREIHAEENMLEILSSLSHDLKTPITAIKGYTEGILDGVADTTEKQQRYLQTIYAKTNDISYLLDELTLFAKIEQNVTTYNFIPVNLESFFTDCIDYFKLDLEQNNISIDYYNSIDFSTNVLIDPRQLRRAIQNIIENAVKYNDKKDGHIYIRIENIPEETSRPLFRYINENGTEIYPRSISESFVRIEIEDNGAGIPEKDLPYIFNRFYRADASRNATKRGSGLGLSIVKMIIYDHGGEVGADSIEGTGSRFYFTLRKVPPSEKTKKRTK